MTGSAPNTPAAPLGLGGAGSVTAGGAVAGSAATGGNSLALHDIVVVRDYPENLAVVDEVVRRLDVQPPQVLIEAVILSVQLNDSQSLGVNFALVDNMRHRALVDGSGALIDAAAGFTPARVLASAPLPAPFLRTQPGLLIPGYTQPDTGMKFGFISHNVSGFIQAIETLNKTNILASPRVLVLNKQRAEIQLGQRLGYRNTVTNLTSSLQTVEFLSVGTLLSLRPFVSNDGMIRMEIHPEKSTGALDSNGIPQTNTSEVTTNIMVPDGATIVIGGLIDDQDVIVEQGIPGLNRIPLLGAAFRTRSTMTLKNELIVLLTPRVIHRGGLPEPQPGLPPRGEMGVPNSGPMPGPALQPIELPQLPPGFEPAGPNPSAETYQLPPSPAPAGSSERPPEAEPSPLLPDTPPPPPPPEVMPPQARAPGGAAALRSGRKSPAATAGIQRPAPRDPATVTSALPASPPAAPAMAGAAAPGDGFQHLVRPGEDFASISRYYYGTPEHGVSLWRANRHQVANPKALRPGTTIVVPPVQLLSESEDTGRVREQPPAPPTRPDRPAEPPTQGLAGTARGASESGPGARIGRRLAGFLNRFQYQELSSWQVPPGVSREEALKGRTSGSSRAWFDRSGMRRPDSPRATPAGPTPRTPLASTPVTTQPLIGARLFGRGREASQAMPGGPAP